MQDRRSWIHEFASVLAPADSHNLCDSQTMATSGKSGFYTVTEHAADPLAFESDAHPRTARTEDEALRIAHMLLRRRSKSELLVAFDNVDGTTEPVGTLDDRGWHPDR